MSVWGAGPAVPPLRTVGVSGRVQTAEGMRDGELTQQMEARPL